MTEKYFTKFPTIYYANTEAIDITRRVKIEAKDRNNPYNYYPFTIEEEIRADQTADFYFNDPEMDWLVYHTNDIIDPYYQWVQTTEVFNTLLIDKYGSVENAMKKVYVYRNNWADDDSTLTVARYQDGIPYTWRKYFKPIWGPKGEILGYERRQIDYYMNTNRLLRYNIQYVSANTFDVGELVDIKYGGQVVGGGEVDAANSTTLTIKSVWGNTVANSSVVVNLLGESSISNATSNTVTTTFESIPLDEEVFWSPYYYYEVELDKNETRKHIRLVNDQLAPLIIQQFEQKLQET